MSLRFLTHLKYWQIIILLVLLALALRGARCFIVDRISKDGVLYVRMAQGVAASDKSEAFIENRRMPPLYILFIAALNRIGISFETAAKIISLLAGSLLIIPFFLVVRLFFGDKAALLSGLLIALHPSLVKVSSTIMRDSMFLSLMVFSVAFIVFAIQKNRYLYWGLGGLFAALASATRAEGFELLLAVFGWMIINLVMIKLRRRNTLLLNDKEGKLRETTKKGEGGTANSMIPSVAGPMIFTLLFFATSQPICESVKGTASTWSVIDRRIIGYAENLISHSSEEALKKEDTL